MYSYKSRLLNDVEYHHLILIRWKWILYCGKSSFLKSSPWKVRRTTNFTICNSIMSGDCTMRSFLLIVMIKLPSIGHVQWILSSSSIRITLAVETVFDAFFFHYGIAQHFTANIKHIICSARVVDETTPDASSLHDVKHSFLSRNRISNENIHRQSNLCPRKCLLRSYLDEEAVSGKTWSYKSKRATNTRTTSFGRR